MYTMVSMSIGVWLLTGERRFSGVWLLTGERRFSGVWLLTGRVTGGR